MFRRFWRFGFTHIRDVISRQQYLCNGLLEVTEKAVPQAHKPTLSNCGQRLPQVLDDFWTYGMKYGAKGATYLDSWKVLWLLFNLHSSQTHTNSPGGHNNDFVAIIMKLHCSLDDQTQCGQKRLMRLLIHY